MDTTSVNHEIAMTNKTIEVDDDTTTSDYDRHLSEGTHSLTPSVIDYVYENGRRYHRYAEGKYVIPNDEIEQNRLDFYHHQQLLMLGGQLFTAPLRKDIKNVLDCGTGTGIWALDMAETFPEADILGVDLSPIQPAWTYRNCKFEVDDLELEWTFAPNFFDFIHSRQLCMSIKDWPNYCRQMYQCTKPGGYVELCEFELNDVHSDDGSLKPSHALAQYYKKFHSCTKAAGLSLPSGEDLKNLLAEAGFVDITVMEQKQPFSPWAKDQMLKRIGQLTYMTLVESKGVESYGIALFTRYGGMTQEQAQSLCDRACEDLRDRNVHVYNYLWHIVARKPNYAELVTQGIEIYGSTGLR